MGMELDGRKYREKVCEIHVNADEKKKTREKGEIWDQGKGYLVSSFTSPSISTQKEM